MKRVLILTSVASMIDQFNMPNIKLLQAMGYEVDVACNFIKGNTCSHEKITELKKNLNQMNVREYQIDFSRNITKIGSNVKAFRQVKRILKENQYEFLHCHSPIGGLVGRVAGKITKTKVIYTAHGFHFYKGAPKKNWILYYPIEKLCSYLTDVLICINKEDFILARKKLKAKKTKYIHGVGVDTIRFDDSKEGNSEKCRRQIGLKNDDILLLSVGELNRNKNHELVIKALIDIIKSNNKIHYAISGKGELRDYLFSLAKENGIADHVHLLGFCNNISNWYQAADIFVFPSHREGLSVALMEAMASGLPVACSKIRGNVDLIDEGKGGYLFSPISVEEVKEVLEKLCSSEKSKFGEYNRNKIKKFDVKQVMEETFKIYFEI